MDPDTTDQQASALDKANTDEDPEIKEVVRSLRNEARAERDESQREQAESDEAEREELNRERYEDDEDEESS